MLVLLSVANREAHPSPRNSVWDLQLQNCLFRCPRTSAVQEVSKHKEQFSTA